MKKITRYSMGIRASEKPKPFASDKQVLEAALRMFSARKALADATRRWQEEDKQTRSLREQARRLTVHWHSSFRMTGEHVNIRRRCKLHRLNRLECEILTALLLSQITLLKPKIQNCAELAEALALPSGKTLEALKCLAGHRRLMRSGLIFCNDSEEDLESQCIRVTDELLREVLTGEEEPELTWPVRKEEELYDYLARLTTALRDKDREFVRGSMGFATRSNVPALDRKIGRLLYGLRATLARHPAWALGRFRTQLDGMEGEWTIFLALLSKELGHVDSSDSLFSGRGLAHALSSREHEIAPNLQRLVSNGRLLSGEFIQPCGGTGETLADSPTEIAQTEFELTPRVREALGLEKSGHKRLCGKHEVRKPKVQMAQLVLSEGTRRAINLALVHTRHEKTLTKTWGLGEMIPYGRNVVLLFSGPPGTGKTASAEALAHELGRPILVVNYADIQDRWVGQTEKNIAHVFNEAKSNNALLFWDEADAMFFDRDTAKYNWEVRDVNVLLQELERFDGVCVLSTNRKIALDKALERRITVKVEFERPDAAARRQIWDKLIPPRMPVAEDVDRDALSRHDLSGGEIKNVVLNAARLALESRGKGPVRMEDFLRATEMEVQGKWNEESREPVGFAHSRPIIHAASLKAGA